MGEGNGTAFLGCDFRFCLKQDAFGKGGKESDVDAFVMRWSIRGANDFD